MERLSKLVYLVTKKLANQGVSVSSNMRTIEVVNLLLII